MYAYCFLTKERRNFEANAEGTQSFIKYQAEQRQSSHIFKYLYADRHRSAKDWILKVRERVHRKRVDPRDEAETEFVDIDVVLGLYIEEYQKVKGEIRQSIRERFMALQAKREGNIDVQDLK